MSESFYTVLTNLGLAEFANAPILQKQVVFSKMAVGDSNGAYYPPTKEATALRNKVWEGGISTVSVDENNPNWIILEAIIPSDVGGFTIREIGVYNDKGGLLAIGKLPETYKPELAQGSSKDLLLKVILEVSNAASVTLKNDPSVIIASKKYVDERMTIITQSLNNQLNNKVGDLSQISIESSEAITNLVQAVNTLNTKIGSLGTLDITGDTPIANIVQAVNALNKINTEHLAENASLTTRGHTQLSNATDSTSDSLSATPSAVKQAYDRGDSAFNNEAELRAEFDAFKAALTEGFTGNQFSDGLTSLDAFIVTVGYFNLPLTRLEV